MSKASNILGRKRGQGPLRTWTTSVHTPFCSQHGGHVPHKHSRSVGALVALVAVWTWRGHKKGEARGPYAYPL